MSSLHFKDLKTLVCKNKTRKNAIVDYLDCQIPVGRAIDRY